MNNLAKYRGKHELTQTQLGEKMGISKAGVSFIEKNLLSPKNAEECAKILGENKFALMGSDVLRVLPETEADKKILIEMIKSL